MATYWQLLAQLPFMLLALLCCVYLCSIAINLIRTGVISLSSNQRVIKVLLGPEVAPFLSGKRRLCDLGAGNGRTLRVLAQHYGLPADGYETEWGAYVAAVLWTRLFYRGSAIRFFCRSFFSADLADYDVIYCFLMDDIMPRVAAEIVPRLKSGTVLISNTFPLPNHTPVYNYQGSAYGLDSLFIYIVE